MLDNPQRVVIDTNVIISALLFGGNSKKIIEKLIRKDFIAFISPQLISELIEILSQKFNFSQEMIKKIQVQILYLFHLVYPSKTVDVVRDRDDNRVIEVALESGSLVIITGDKDLLILKKYKNILIVSPKDFLTMVN